MKTYDFPFGIGNRVRIKASDEEGSVRAVSINSTGVTSMYVHYQAADGRAVESWWEADLLELVE